MLPFSLLLLLASSSTLTLASIPPDPFSHPKYSLSFLNDLPIEHSQAQRWIQNGLPSSSSTTGVDVFFGAVEGRGGERERMEIEEKQEEEVVENLVREGEGDELNNLSGDELDQIILSSPSTPPPDLQDSFPPTSSTSNYTLQHLLLPPGPRSYLCLLPPPPPPPPHPLSALPPPPPMDPSLPDKLLTHLKGGCLYIKQGWFTYAYCHGLEVRQFRAAPPPWPPLPGGYVPAIDATVSCRFVRDGRWLCSFKTRRDEDGTLTFLSYSTSTTTTL
ncbi:hypothetical protein BDY24DRAFT_77501 [Mrakia frigida]|uniref:PRKCSH domain-containing protein n=1 Tax=Mrakia frigida TaxID=29902 RepID=UPI003FCC04F9